MTSEKKKKLIWWVIGILAASIIAYLWPQNISSVREAASWAFDIVFSLVLGLAFALIINVPMQFFERLFWHKKNTKTAGILRRILAYIVSLILILSTIAGIIWLVIPELVEAVTVIATRLIDFITKISSMSESEIAEMPFGEYLLYFDWDRILEILKNWLKNQGGALVGTAIGTVGSLVGVIFDFFISIVFSVYILFTKETLKSQCARLIRVWLPDRLGEGVIHASSVFNTSLRSFILGQTMEAILIGVLCMIGMLILRLPYAAPVGALVGVTAFVPVVGSFVGAIAGAFLILTVSPMKAIIFIIYLIILQQIESNIIYPKVMGSNVNLPGLWILASVTIGGGIGGAVGMLLAVPVASTLYVLLKEATAKREEQKRALDLPSKPLKTADGDTDAREQTCENTENAEEPKTV